jgi:uracil-DNA glycosylase
MLISETPGRYPPPNQSFETASSLTEHFRMPNDIWNFWGMVEKLFGNGFRPGGDDKTRSTVYWTHYQKCSKMEEDKKTLRYLGGDCADKYLETEIRLVNPKLMIALGMNAGEFLVERYHLKPLASVECRMGRRPRLVHVRTGTFQAIDDREYAILCHPSGASRYRKCAVFQNEYRKLIQEMQAAINQLLPKL